MNKLRCLVIDDEPVARKIIREYIEDVDFLELTGEAENAMEADKLFKEKELDLIFLDVQMPGMSGIEFLQKTCFEKMVVMTTAYPQYALQGFELDVMDYLVKPIPFERFYKAAAKCLDYNNLRSGTAVQAEDTIFVKCDRKIEKIMTKDILYVKGMANYVIIYTAERRYITYMTFKGIEEKLPAAAFARIHKSYLISVAAISSIGGNEVMIGKNKLPVSKFYKNSFLKAIDPLILKR